MKMKKLTNEELIKQAKMNKIVYSIMAVMSILFLVLHFITSNIRFGIITLTFVMFALYGKHQEMYDKIRLEIRELK